MLALPENKSIETKPFTQRSPGQVWVLARSDRKSLTLGHIFSLQEGVLTSIWLLFKSGYTSETETTVALYPAQ